MDNHFIPLTNRFFPSITSLVLSTSVLRSIFCRCVAPTRIFIVYTILYREAVCAFAVLSLLFFIALLP